jgi:hypothetical protein
VRVRSLIIGVPLTLLVVFVVLHFAAQAWLESADGKQALEQQLRHAVDMPVELAGDLEIEFLPAPGVVGSDLRLLDPLTGDTLAGSRRYSLDLALVPLMRKQLVVERLELEWLTLGATGGPRFAVPAVAVSHFAVNQPSGLSIDLGWLGAITGEFTWRPGPGEVELDLEWLAEDRDAIAVAGRVVYFPDRASFHGVTARVAGQVISGEGCFLSGVSPAINFDLAADTLDLDALAEAFPGGQGGAEMLPLTLNLRLRVDEMVRGGVRAVDALLELGSAPACP